jgi:hypothetical protein
MDKLVTECLLTPEELDDNKYWYDKYHGVRDLDAIQVGLLTKAIPIIRKAERERIKGELERLGVLSHRTGKGCSDCIDTQDCMRLEIETKWWQYIFK